MIPWMLRPCPGVKDRAGIKVTSGLVDGGCDDGCVGSGCSDDGGCGRVVGIIMVPRRTSGTAGAVTAAGTWVWRFRSSAAAWETRGGIPHSPRVPPRAFPHSRYPPQIG